MSNRALTWAFGQDLKSGPKFVLVALADWADDEGSCFPGIQTIAKRVGAGATSVRENLARLKEAGLVVEARRNRPSGARTSNRYWLQMSGRINLEPESGGHVLEPESEQPTAGIRGGQEPESGGVSEPLELNHQLNTSGSGRADPSWMALCQMLSDRIEANGSKRPTITKAWLNSARLMVESDGRTVDQISKMIDWCQRDTCWWRSNILSMPKLREKYDQMRLQSLRPPESQGRNPAAAVQGGQTLVARLESQNRMIDGGRP